VLRFFEIIPSLLSIFQDQESTEDIQNSLAEKIQKLVEKFVNALEERKNRHRLYDVILPEIVSILTRGLKNYHRNDPDLLLLVSLQLYSFLTEERAAGLLQLLKRPSSMLSGTIHRVLSSKKDPFIFRFLVQCLDKNDPPPLALSVLSKRTDLPFITFFLSNLKNPLSETIKSNLAQIPPLSWLNAPQNLLNQLNEEAQSGMVELVQNLNFSETEIQSKLIDIFHHGKGKCRLDALTLLATFSGERIDQLIWDAGGDSDPNVQAEALSLLSKRNIPNASSRILQFANSPNDLVRETIQKLLPNFRFSRFFDTFDQLKEEQRRMLFNVVKMLDSQTVDELANILVIGEPKSKAKALLCIEYGKLVPALEDALCSVLAKGELPLLRSKAAELLAEGRRELSRSTLVQSLHRDVAPEVRAAAKKSLENRPTSWETTKNPAQGVQKN
jgi:HEAT repeat protein